MKESRWTEFFGPDVSPKGSWWSLDKLPVEERTADLYSSRYRVHLDPEQREECMFCSQIETLAHLFIQCPRLAALFELLKRWFQGLGEDFSFGLFIFGPKYSAKKKSVHTLVNFLSGSAKLAIWLTRRNRAQSVGSVEPVLVLKGLLKARLRLDNSTLLLPPCVSIRQSPDPVTSHEHVTPPDPPVTSAAPEELWVHSKPCGPALKSHLTFLIRVSIGVISAFTTVLMAAMLLSLVLALERFWRPPAVEATVDDFNRVKYQPKPSVT
ncbi:hypothetical protein N1851_022699 [Merluccius polli]|uniref:Reverse transcriptase zinc-binding domain-containing protein n=1 Tax=Merluccius polli TaxID=89951 RepID=A0AA47MHU4_MERPO|nr:hypothetical protein N1851_022699 [Merluccius polli]